MAVERDGGDFDRVGGGEGEREVEDRFRFSVPVLGEGDVERRDGGVGDSGIAYTTKFSSADMGGGRVDVDVRGEVMLSFRESWSRFVKYLQLASK